VDDVTDPEKFHQVGGDQENPDSSGGELTQQGIDFRPGPDVYSARRVVEYQDL